MEQVFERALVEHCAPTLAGVKAANLFTVRDTEPEEVRRWVARWDAVRMPLGIRMHILRERLQTGCCVIYVYRPRWLERILADQGNWFFLRGIDYRDRDLDGALSRLSARFAAEGDFPHAVGVFLGYPLEDVVGFIRHQGRNFTCRGYWKSYGDPTAAQKRFDRYRACTRAYKRMYGNGTPILGLVIAA